MTIAHIRSRTRLRRHAACIVAGLITSTTAKPAAAQLTTADKVKLRTQGFTAADLRSADLALIAPHYTHYRAWLQCLSGTVPAVLHLQPPNVETFIKFTRLDCDPHLVTLRASLAQRIGLPQAERSIRLLNTYLANGLRESWDERARVAANPSVRRPQPDPPAPPNWKLHRTAKGCVAQFTPPQTSKAEIYINRDERGYDLVLRRRRVEETPEGTIYIVSMHTPEYVHQVQTGIMSSRENGTEWLKIVLGDAELFYLSKTKLLTIRPVALKRDTKEVFDISAVTEDLMSALRVCSPRGS